MTHNAHLANGARLRAITRTPTEMMFSCRDCGIDAWGFEEDCQIVHEDFYVSNAMWDAVCPDDEVVRWVQDGREFGMGYFVMCIGCFEKRLGRKLTRPDLRSGPGLNVEGNPPSKRFVDRWGSACSKPGSP